MLDVLKKSVLASLGVVELSAEKAKEAVDKLVKKGTINREEAKKLVDDLVARGKKEKKKLETALEKGLSAGLKATNMVSRKEFENLQKKVSQLEAQLKKRSRRK
jgi:polyhydroxyalkanoate synthesis regulator phasin